ncbi:MAG TPA: hypothetical protein VGA00_04845 [Acidiferrobacterales bacterium]
MCKLGCWALTCVLLTSAWVWAAQTADPPAADTAAPAGEDAAADAAAPGEPPAPAGVALEYLRPLTGIESGRNDSNPVWSRSGRLIGFERSRGEKKELLVARNDGSIVETIYFQLSEGSQEPRFYFPGVLEETSYNAGIAWSPDDRRLVFMSNGGEGNYDLYLRELGGKTARLTHHREKDGHADWSPADGRIAFVSGRSGKGDVYVADPGGAPPRRLTVADRPFLYPQWSPDGKRIAVIHGANENHDIIVIDGLDKPQPRLTALTTWEHDDLRPVWSPDGKWIAFYSNYNEHNDPKIWAILVVAADGSDPKSGAGLAARVVATDVVPDVERGPAWLPDSRRILYVKDDRLEYNPIRLVDLRDGSNHPVPTGTQVNHDLACAPTGEFAFRAQVDQWDQIFIGRLKE